MFSCEICEIFNSTYFEEHMRTAASILIEDQEQGAPRKDPVFPPSVEQRKTITVRKSN